MKTIVILLDGMRPDAITDIPQVKNIMEKASYTMKGTTVFPSVTLPCHMSLFHSVDPARHGTTTNTYMPQVRPIKGLCEVLQQNGKRCAMFYSWEPLRDVARPDSLMFSYFLRGGSAGIGHDICVDKVTDAAVEYLNRYDTDFAFIYMGYPDGAGHAYGWMSEEYLKALQHCWKNVERIIRDLKDEYTFIITADHGGHDRTHGVGLPEDMQIPVFILGRGYEAGVEIESVNIKDIAPTIAHLLCVNPDEEWEGRVIFPGDDVERKN